jgi:hypothetical protein
VSEHLEDTPRDMTGPPLTAAMSAVRMSRLERRGW